MCFTAKHARSTEGREQNRSKTFQNSPCQTTSTSASMQQCKYCSPPSTNLAAVLANCAGCLETSIRDIKSQYRSVLFMCKLFGLKCVYALSSLLPFVVYRARAWRSRETSALRCPLQQNVIVQTNITHYFHEYSITTLTTLHYTTLHFTTLHYIHYIH